jgi:hypothetical protein
MDPYRTYATYATKPNRNLPKLPYVLPRRHYFRNLLLTIPCSTMDKSPGPPRYGMELAEKHDAAGKLAIEIKDLQTRLLHSSKHTKPASCKWLATASNRFRRYQTEIARRLKSCVRRMFCRREVEEKVYGDTKWVMARSRSRRIVKDDSRDFEKSDVKKWNRIDDVH